MLFTGASAPCAAGPALDAKQPREHDTIIGRFDGNCIKAEVIQAKRKYYGK
jgi:hypothetical protein